MDTASPAAAPSSGEAARRRWRLAVAKVRSRQGGARGLAAAAAKEKSALSAFEQSLAESNAATAAFFAGIADVFSPTPVKSRPSASRAEEDARVEELERQLARERAATEAAKLRLASREAELQRQARAATANAGTSGAKGQRSLSQRRHDHPWTARELGGALAAAVALGVLVSALVLLPGPTQELGRESAEPTLPTAVPALREELRIVSARLQVAEEERVALRAELKNAKSKSADLVASAEAACATRVAEAKASQSAQLEKLKASQSAQLSELKASQSTQLAELKAAHSVQLASATADQPPAAQPQPVIRTSWFSMLCYILFGATVGKWVGRSEDAPRGQAQESRGVKESQSSPAGSPAGTPERVHRRDLDGRASAVTKAVQEASDSTCMVRRLDDVVPEHVPGSELELEVQLARQRSRNGDADVVGSADRTLANGRPPVTPLNGEKARANGVVKSTTPSTSETAVAYGNAAPREKGMTPLPRVALLASQAQARIAAEAELENALTLPRKGTPGTLRTTPISQPRRKSSDVITPPATRQWNV